MSEACNTLNMDKEPGFTLIELLIVIVVVTILLAAGVPAFKDFIKNNRVTAQANALAVAIQMGRNEAVKRGVNVVVCASKNATDVKPKCSGSADWSTGWITFADLDGDNLPHDDVKSCPSGGDCFISARDNPLKGNSLTADDITATSLIYLPTGVVANGDHHIKLKSKDCVKNQARDIHITLQGHTIVTTIACGAA